MSRDLAVLAPAGLGRIDGLYAALGDRGWRVTLREIEDPPALVWAARLLTLRPTPSARRRAYLRFCDRWSRTGWAFEQRSRAAARALAGLERRPDCILQIGGMSDPGARPFVAPYAIFCDCTVRVGEGRAYSGCEFRSAAQARDWYRRERALYHGAAALLPASEYARRSLIDDYGVPPERAVAVGEGCNLSAPERLEREPRDPDARTVLFVGYEFERKGGRELLEAFRRVRAELPDAELVIAGPRRIAGPLPEGARLVGAASRAQLATLLERAALFTLPSLFEPYGLVLLEAMEYGLPCVGSDCGAMAEIVVEGETGRIVPAGDVGALAGRLTELLRSPELRRRMGEAGRRRVRERFTWSAVAARVDAHLEGRLGGGARRVGNALLRLGSTPSPRPPARVALFPSGARRTASRRSPSAEPEVAHGLPLE